MRSVDGYYWMAPLSDRRWGVFWSHPNHGAWHLLVAEFRDQRRAEVYVEVSNDCLETDDGKQFADEAIKPPKALVAPTNLVKPPMLNSFLVPLADRLRADLQKLFAEHPDGVTPGLVMKRYSVNYNDACEALRWMDSNGFGRWIFPNGQGGGKRLVRPDDPTVERALTHRQETVLIALQRLADSQGCVEKTHQSIAASAGVGVNGLNQTLYALEKKGFLTTARPAAKDGSYRPIYQILKPIEEPSIGLLTSQMSEPISS